MLPKYNKAAESVFLTKYCAVINVISFFIAKYITMTNLVLIFHVKVLKNLNISLLLDLNLKVKKNLNIPFLLDLNLNISLLLELKAPKLLLLISSQLSYLFPKAYIYNNRWQIRYEGLRKKGILKRNTLNTSLLYKDPWWPKSLNIVNNPPSYHDLSIAPSRDDNG